MQVEQQRELVAGFDLLQAAEAYWDGLGSDPERAAKIDQRARQWLKLRNQ